MRWHGSSLSPLLLFRAAREARCRGWLSGSARVFLHRAGMSLAAGEPLTAEETLLLDDLLRRLRDAGSATLSAIEAGPAAQGAVTPAAGTPPGEAAPGGDPAGEPPQPASAPPAAGADPALAALQAEVRRLAVMLASAGESMELCRAEIARLQAGQDPAAPPGA